MTPEDIDALSGLLDSLTVAEGYLSLDQVEDDNGRAEWQMEICGKWFWGLTARDCFLKALRTYKATPETPETLNIRESK